MIWKEFWLIKLRTILLMFLKFKVCFVYEVLLHTISQRTFLWHDLLYRLTFVILRFFLKYSIRSLLVTHIFGVTIHIFLLKFFILFYFILAANRSVHWICVSHSNCIRRHSIYTFFFLHINSLLSLCHIPY